MIDWHSHILPNMDDGSHSVAESISLLNLERSQGVSVVVATPHFYANDESVDSFLSRRTVAMNKLKADTTDGLPQIILGAEVKYYHGVSRMEGLSSLRIEGTKLLLLEMPLSKWTEFMIRELFELSAKSGIQVVLAHVERYWKLQDHSTWARLSECGIMFQANASFFASFSSRRRAISLLKDGKIHIIGSDCHNLTSRPPNLAKAFDIIRKKLGNEYVTQMNEYGDFLLKTNRQ